MSAPKAILFKGKVIKFSGYDRAVITSRAAGYSYHNGTDFKKECYAVARSFAATA
jgi:hypothetical protein